MAFAVNAVHQSRGEMTASFHRVLRSSTRLASSMQTACHFVASKRLVFCLPRRHHVNAVFSAFNSPLWDNADSSLPAPQQSFLSRRHLNNAAFSSKREKLYTKTHEYVRFVSSDPSEAAVGVSHFAAEELGDVVHIEALVSEQARDARVVKGDAVCTLEALKSVAEVYAPLSGRILSYNEKVKRDPGLINRDPEGDGWIFRMAVDTSESLEGGQTEKSPQEAARSSLLSASERLALIVLTSVL
ncbi:hypothetical protein Efla_001473 [Eimeria flavescens]